MLTENIMPVRLVESLGQPFILITLGRRSVACSGPMSYRQPHLEIITLDALRHILGMWPGPSGLFGAPE